MFLRERSVLGQRRALEPWKYVINLIGGRRTEAHIHINGKCRFRDRKHPEVLFPLVPHRAITQNSRNIPGLFCTLPHPPPFTLLPPPSPTPRPCAFPAPAQSFAEDKRPFPELLCRESNLLSRATKSRDPDFATWLSSPSMTMPSTMPTLFSFLLLLYPHFASSHLFHSLPDDLYSFPKHRVTFLNGLPLLNETAERWLREGLRGGEAEFLDNPTPWQEPSPFKHIDAGEGAAVCS